MNEEGWTFPSELTQENDERKLGDVLPQLRPMKVVLRHECSGKAHDIVFAGVTTFIYFTSKRKVAIALENGERRLNTITGYALR